MQGSLISLDLRTRVERKFWNQMPPYTHTLSPYALFHYILIPHRVYISIPHMPIYPNIWKWVLILSKMYTF